MWWYEQSRSIVLGQDGLNDHLKRKPTGSLPGQRSGTEEEQKEKARYFPQPGECQEQASALVPPASHAIAELKKPPRALALVQALSPCFRSSLVSLFVPEPHTLDTALARWHGRHELIGLNGHSVRAREDTLSHTNLLINNDR